MYWVVPLPSVSVLEIGGLNGLISLLRILLTREYCQLKEYNALTVNGITVLAQCAIR